ncbi:trigger factor [Marasmitruncus massiliensis]|uniref:trigger factor n=1 Tax=Marasmitruncus massiliensis TaxID=1944642 RepID=UPI000C79ACA9|nr:trigger factor [Marasmitruncus massiliensis]
MSVKSVKTNEDKKVELEIAVSAEDFNKAVDAAFKKNGKKINVPGFRKGKAPRKMVEKMYGEGMFFEEAVNNTYPAAYQAAVKEANIDPVDRADIEIMEVSKENGYTFKATVTVKPEVTLEGYKGIEVEKKVSVVTDEEVDAEIGRQREQNARVIAVEGRAAANGDTAVIDFEGFVDDVAFEGGKGTDYSLVLGSNSFIPGFEDQVAGHNVGESFEVNVTFPEDYHAEELKGKAAMFKVTMKELKMKELPELDDEFAKDVSEFDTLDELKADVSKKLQEKKDEQSDTDVENKLMEAVANKMVVDIPDCMFESRVDEMLRDFEYRLQSQGMDLKNYLQYTGMELDAFRKTFRPQAEAQVKTRLALEKIVELEKIEPTSDEVEAEYLNIAQQYKMEVEKVKGIVPTSDIKSGLAMNKALDIVRENAKISETNDAEPKRKKTTRTKKAAAKTETAEEAVEAAE